MKSLERNQLKNLMGGLAEDYGGTCGAHGTYESNDPFNHYGLTKAEAKKECAEINAGGGHCKWCCASCASVMDVN